MITLDIEENLLKKTRNKLLHLKFKLYLLISVGVSITVFLKPYACHLKLANHLLPNSFESNWREQKKLTGFKREMVMLEEETALYTVKHSWICVHILDAHLHYSKTTFFAVCPEHTRLTKLFLQHLLCRKDDIITFLNYLLIHGMMAVVKTM